MKQQYYTDTMANYLIIMCPAEALEGYQYRMLAVNRIRGLLPCSLRTIDGQSYLYYEITSRQSLARRYDHRVISGAEMKSILYSITSMMKSLSDYLLDDTHLFMDPEYIFYDYEKEAYWFTYYPEQRDETSLSRLFAYLAEKVDPQAQEASAVIYRLCDLSSNPGFVMREELLDHEYEQAGQQEQAHIPGEERQAAYGERGADLRFSEEDEDLFDMDDMDVNHQARQDNSGTGRGRKERRRAHEKSGDNGSRKPRRISAAILITAILFLAAAAACGAAAYLWNVSATTLLALRAGMISCLVVSVACAVYGTIYVWRRNKLEKQQIQQKEEEERRNAMMPTAEYPTA